MSAVDRVVMLWSANQVASRGVGAGQLAEEGLAKGARWRARGWYAARVALHRGSAGQLAETRPLGVDAMRALARLDESWFATWVASNRRRTGRLAEVWPRGVDAMSAVVREAESWRATWVASNGGRTGRLAEVRPLGVDAMSALVREAESWSGLRSPLGGLVLGARVEACFIVRRRRHRSSETTPNERWRATRVASVRTPFERSIGGVGAACSRRSCPGRGRTRRPRASQVAAGRSPLELRTGDVPGPGSCESDPVRGRTMPLRATQVAIVRAPVAAAMDHGEPCGARMASNACPSWARRRPRELPSETQPADRLEAHVPAGFSVPFAGPPLRARRAWSAP